MSVIQKNLQYLCLKQSLKLSVFPGRYNVFCQLTRRIPNPGHWEFRARKLAVNIVLRTQRIM